MMLTRNNRVALAILFTGSAGIIALAAQEPGAPPTVDPERAKLFTVPALAKLDIFVGAWKVRETYFDERGVGSDGRSGTEEVLWVLDHHTLYRRYNTATDDQIYRAIGMITWSEPEGIYRGNWYDNAPGQGPSPRTIRGSFDENTATLKWTMDALSKDGKPLKYQVVERFVDVEERVSTTFVVDGGRITKLMEVNYTRAEPCPASRGTVILGG